MGVGAFVPVGVFGLVASAVAVRLLLLWRRTRALPELTIGLGLCTLAFVGLPLSAVGRLSQLGGRTGPGGWLFVAGMIAVSMGIFLLYLFTWSVFRRRAVWVRAMLGCVAGLLAATLVGTTAVNLSAADPAELVARSRPFNIAYTSLVGLCFVWTGIESSLYYRAARRRLRLGLGDPVVANRFLLWAASGWSTSCLCGALLVAVIRGIVVMNDPLSLYGIAAAGVIMSASWYLAFFAPAPYRAFIARRALALG